MNPGTRVAYKEPALRRQFKTFKTLPCSCDLCQSGDTYLVDLPSELSPGNPTKHVGHEMIESVLPVNRVVTPKTWNRSP
jgi:hypothetical protein